MFKLCYTVEPRFNKVPVDWGNLFVIHFSTVLYIATALETQEQANKLLKTIVHINFIIVGLLIAFIFSYRLVTLTFISYIEVYFTFALLGCVPYNEDFVKSRFYSLYRGSVPYILLQFWPG